MIRKEILPLAITEVDDTYACVAGISLQYEWIRPEPVYILDIISNSEIDFEHITSFELENNKIGRRMEDRQLTKNHLIRKEYKISNDEKEKMILKVCESSVDEVFNSKKTAGIFKVKIKDISYGRIFGAGNKIRIIYEDETGVEFNNIVVDIKFKKWFLANYVDCSNRVIESKKAVLLEKIRGCHSYFTITLSDEKGDFRGTYNSCFPLISGIHILDFDLYAL